jgi:hypothetical protein
MLHTSEPVVIQLVRQNSRVNQSPARRHVALHCSIVQGSAAIQIGEVNILCVETKSNWDVLSKTQNIRSEDL